MPGKHAPDSSASFLLSLGRAAAGALAAVGLVVAIVVIAITSRGDGGDVAAPGPTSSPTVTASATPSPTATRTTEGSPSPTATPSETVMRDPMLPKRSLDVEVLNGNGVPGAAGEVQQRLQRAGYRDIQTANTDLTARTTIYYRGALRREARRLLNEFPEFRRVREAGSGTPGQAQITIVLGRDHEPSG